MSASKSQVKPAAQYSTTTGSSTTVKNPGNLADLRDEAYFSGKLPAGSTDTDKHSASGRVFALKTVGGGVLAFYALTAQLTLAPPPGQTFQVGIPGFYSSSQALTSAAVDYADQFAVFLPAGLSWRGPRRHRRRLRYHQAGLTGNLAGPGIRHRRGRGSGRRLVIPYARAAPTHSNLPRHDMTNKEIKTNERRRPRPQLR